MKKKTIIGLEIHCSLNTKSKLFCSCPNRNEEKEQPNSRTCPICLGHPGSKPLTNGKAVTHALKIALGLKCKISNVLRFARKSYFYPDLPKNYQITQYEHPLGTNGALSLPNGKLIRVSRVHLEEDPGAIIDRNSHTLIDYNRSGTPLVEIVTEPDLETPEEARQLIRVLQSIVHYLKVYSPASGIIKVDANISIEESGFVRVEIKNILGQKDIYDALTYEIIRQRQAIIDGQTIHKETRHWEESTKITISMRTKEEDEDYGYIEEPDLILMKFDPKLIKKIMTEIPELPTQKRARFVNDYGLSKEDAQILCASPYIAEIFEKVSKEVESTFAAHWIRRDLLHQIVKYSDTDIETYLLKKDSLAYPQLVLLLQFISTGMITAHVGKNILETLFKDLKEPIDIKNHVKINDLKAIQEEGVLKKICLEAIRENPGAVKDYRSGKNEALHFLLGAVMKASKGKADPVETKRTLMLLLENTTSEISK